MHLVKTHTKNVLLLPLLIASFGLMPVAPLRAQTFTTLHDFTGGGYDSSGSYTNSDGADLVAGLIPRQQVLVKRPNLAKVVNLHVDPKEYWLYTNSPYDNARRREAFEKYGFERGLEVLAQESAS